MIQLLIKLLAAFVLTLLSGTTALAGIWESLSQGTHYLATGGGCDGFDSAKASQALDRATSCYQSDLTGDVVPQRLDLAQLTNKISEPAEDRLFAVLAQQHARELNCSADFAKDIRANQKNSAKDLAEKIKLLHAAKKQLVHATKEVAENPQALSKSCALRLEDLSENDQFCRAVVSARTNYQMIYSSIPLSDVPVIKKLIETQANTSEVTADLETKVRVAYGEAQEFLKSEGSKLSSKAKKEGGQGFDRNARYALLADPRVTEKVIQDSGGSSDFKNLVCRADARFKKGADYLQTGLFVGSLALGGASAVVTKVGSAAWKIYEGAETARAAGLFSLNATRILQASAAGLSSLSTYHDIDKACGSEAVTKFVGSCVGAPHVKQLEQDSCILAQSLAASQITLVVAPPIVDFIKRHRILTKASKEEPLITPVVPKKNQVGEVAKSEEGFRSPVQPRKGIESVPSVRDYPLPNEFKKNLINDPTVQELKSIYGDGKGMKIVIYPDLDKPMELVNGAAKPTGETLQALFVQRSLKTIFPEAEIGGTKAFGKQDGVISLSIRDSAELRNPSDLRTPDPAILEMSSLKMANPGVGTIDKAAMRETLGIPKDSRVLSVNNSLYNTPLDVEDLIRASGSAKPDVVIVSIADRKILERINTHLEKTMGDQYKIVRLSELDGKPLEETKNVIVLNDTFGRMHSVYAVSDVNLTAGAVNLSEPLLMKTPTVFFDHHSDFMHGYDPSVFAKMGRQATQTGGAQAVANEREMAAKVKSYMDASKKVEIRAPYTIADDKGKTPLNQFTDDLKQQIIMQSPETPVMPKVLASPAAKEYYLKNLREQFNDLSGVMNSSSRDAYNEAIERIQDLRIPTEQMHLLAPAEVSEIQKNIESLRTRMLKGVRDHIARWDETATALMDMEKHTSVVFKRPGVQNGLTEETREAIRKAIEADKKKDRDTSHLLKDFESLAPSAQIRKRMPKEDFW